MVGVRHNILQFVRKVYRLVLVYSAPKKTQ